MGLGSIDKVIGSSTTLPPVAFSPLEVVEVSPPLLLGLSAVLSPSVPRSAAVLSVLLEE